MPPEDLATTRMHTTRLGNITREDLHTHWGGQTDAQFYRGQLETGYEVAMTADVLGGRFLPNRIDAVRKAAIVACQNTMHLVSHVPALWKHADQITRKGEPGIRPYSLTMSVAYMENMMGTPQVATLQNLLQDLAFKFSDDVKTQNAIAEIEGNRADRKVLPVNAVIMEIRDSLKTEVLDQAKELIRKSGVNMDIQTPTLTEAVQAAICRTDIPKAGQSSTLAYYVDSKKELKQMWVHFDPIDNKVSLCLKEESVDAEVTSPSIEHTVISPIVTF